MLKRNRIGTTQGNWFVLRTDNGFLPAATACGAGPWSFDANVVEFQR